MDATFWAFVALIIFLGFVVYRSFQVAGHECNVCIEFRGNQMCRSVQAATAEEALGSAINNACAHLASGVTDSMACERTKPLKAECRAFN